MKRIKYNIGLLLVGGVLLSAPIAHAQSPADAYRNVQKGIHGTARAQGLGGAVGALGVDATAVYVNPAGSALGYRHYVSLTSDLGRSATDVRWNNNVDPATSVQRDFRSNQFNNFSSFSPAWYNEVGARKTFIKVNWGFSYNKDYSYKRDYEMPTGPLQFGLTDFMALKGTASGVPFKEYWQTKNYNPFLHSVDPLVAMGVNGEFIESYPTGGITDANDSHYFRTTLSAYPADKSIYDPYHLFLPAQSTLNVSERGGKHTFDFNTSVGFDDRYFFGATLRVGSMNYQRNSMYREDVNATTVDPTNGMSKVNRSWIEYGNELNVSGASFGLNLGAIIAIGDYARVGVSYLLPQYATYKEVYQATTLMQNDDFVGDQRINYESGEYRNEYAMFMPGELTLSAVGLFGHYGLVSYDFGYRNLGHSRLMIGGTTKPLGVNNFIKEDYGHELTHRVGVEFNPISWLTLRGGYSFTGNPMKVDALRNDPVVDFGAGQYGLTYDATTSGMIPDFVLPRKYQTYSAGVGFKFGRRYSLDLTYVGSQRTEKVYPFTGLSFPEGKLGVVGGDMDTSRHSLVATFVVSY